jgi:hypothetical protein
VLSTHDYGVVPNDWLIAGQHYDYI